VKRRDLIIAGLLVTATARRVRAQQTTKLPRVGVLTMAENQATAILEGLRIGLRELGYVEGRTIILDYRFAKGRPEALPGLAEELVRIPADVIVTDTTLATRAAQNVTRTVPIVMGFSLDPVTLGVAASITRPGGNVTGMTIGASELAGKRLELLSQAIPGIARVTVLQNPNNPSNGPLLHETERASKVLGIKVTALSAGDPNELRAETPAGLSDAQGLVVLNDAMFWNYRSTIIALSAAARVPAVYPERDYADDGGLIAYGANAPDSFRRAAQYVDRILRGANPGDLPINEASKFDFVVNLKTAKALGLTIPPSLLARADEVIE
jgi:putative ABC transport system substrate-binding protein